MFHCRFILFAVVVLLAACTTGKSPTLGESVTLSPGWSSLKQSANEAVSDPNVWASLLAAAVLQVSDLDQEISDQLRQHNPLFGSSERANDRSNDFRSLTTAAYVSTAILVPGPEEKWWSTKAKLLGSEWLALQATGSITSGLKSLTNRQRPNNLDDKSFPSGHTSRATIEAQMANLNVNHLTVDTSTKRNLRWTFNGLAVMTGWARVEAGMHFPSDVLSSWALGSFMAHMAQSFIVPDQSKFQIYSQPVSDGMLLQIVTRF